MKKLAALLLLLTGPAVADEVRYYEQNGMTYRETRQTVPVASTGVTYQECPRTVYRVQPTTENRDMVRTWWTPVTEYRQESYWVNRWNPFAEPYLASRYVPVTRWEKKTEVVQMPVACSKLVPETQTVRVPVATNVATREIITREAIPSANPALVAKSSSAPLTPPVASSTILANPWSMTPVDGSSVARREQVGGVGRLENEPPRFPVQPSGQSSALR